MSDVTSRAWFILQPGMLLIDGSRVVRAHPNPAVFNLRAVHPDGTLSMLTVPIRIVEDDPATLGCLTQRARELWGDPRLHVTPHPVRGLWYAHDREGRVVATGPTEFAALLAACDAAPGGAT